MVDMFIFKLTNHQKYKEPNAFLWSQKPSLLPSCWNGLVINDNYPINNYHILKLDIPLMMYRKKNHS